MLSVAPKKFVVLFVAPLGFLGGCNDSAAPSVAKDKAATIQIERKAGSFWAIPGASVNVLVNGRQIADLGESSSLTCQFETKPDFKNTLEVLVPSRLVSEIGDQESTPYKSKKVEFSAYPGSTTKVSFALDPNLMKRTVQIKFPAPDYHEVYSIEPVITTDKQGQELVSVSVNKQELKEVVSESPVINVPFGTDKNYSDKHTVEHSVDIATNWSASAELKANAWAVWGDAALDVKAAIEQSTRERYSDKEEKEESLVLHGVTKPTSHFVVKWLQYYKTGVAKIRTKGKVIDVPFRFPAEADMEAENAG